MMGEKASLHADVASWRRAAQGEPASEMAWSTVAVAPDVRTELSATVFEGESADWVRYLGTPIDARYEPGVAVRVLMQPDLHLIAFDPENEDSRWLADLLTSVLRWLRQRAQRKPNVLALFEELLFENPSDAVFSPRVVLSPLVPSSGTRESGGDDSRPSRDTRFVLSSRLVRRIHNATAEGSGLSDDEKLGLAWPLASRLLSQISSPLVARDRFVAKIDSFARLTYLAVNLLYDGYRDGRFVPNGAGDRFEASESESSALPRARLFEQHPYFRALGKLSFLLRALPYASYADEARIVACEYLDSAYLRLSLASAMPERSLATSAMPLERRWGRLRTPRPRVGQHGVIDKEDEAAWKALSGPLRDVGFILLRQIGVGDFGRVYEVQNQHSPHLPSRVALKVDRIMGRKKQAILEATAAAQVGGELARAPHLVRLYDTGKVQGQRYTYHVLQLIDGDTIDKLIQVSGAEHASTGWPPSIRTSLRQAREEYKRAVRRLDQEQQTFRRRQLGLPFRYPLSAPMVLDVLTSVLLTVEEVHQLGYSINDLKNDNLMMSRRGQIKGIDLDSFAPIHTPFDKVTDFMFLAASVILLVFNAPSSRPRTDLSWMELAEDEARLRAELARNWPLGAVEASSDGRVSQLEVTELLVDLVKRCHHLVYTNDPGLFSADIAHLIRVKRRLRTEELVID